MIDDAFINSLAKLTSEERNADTMDLDTLNSLELVTRINTQDKQVPLAVEKVLPQIAIAVDAISHALSTGGRLIYVGAGTSGRLGILDASECPPTFGVEETMVIGLIAGGTDAIQRSKEGAEDSPEQGQQDLKDILLTNKDVVVGIAASGRTPYVIGALEYAKSVGAVTAAVSCNQDSPIAALADIDITPIVGPEVLTGSTRLKSGTAQKLVLNMLTTASMVRIGKSYQNLMVDVQASNEKLVARAIRIVMQATDCSKEEAIDSLKQSQNDVKKAILIKLTGLSLSDATKQLSESAGHLRDAINSYKR